MPTATSGSITEHNGLGTRLTPHTQKSRLLLEFLEDAFTVDQFRHFLTFSIPGGQALVRELPDGSDVARRRYMHLFVELFERMGPSDPAFFAALRESRPARFAEIEAVKQLYCTGSLLRAVEKVRQTEDSLTEEAIDSRNDWWDDYQRYIDNLPPDERFQAQRLNSLVYMEHFGLSVHELKAHLATLGFYNGPIDDEFDPATASSLEKLQRRNNLRHVDGICGQVTIHTLFQLLGRVRPGA